jgi:hypothetical protein
MTDDSTDRSRWPQWLQGAFWLAVILFALAGLLVVRDLPAWTIALVIVAGVALGAVLFLPRWLAKRRDPAYSAGRSFGAFALAGALGMVGLASLPLYYLAFWVQTGPTAVPLATLSNGQKTVVFQGMQHVASEDFYKSVVFDLEQALADGYTLFYEGVTPVDGRPDLTEWFDKTLRGSNQDLSAAYKKMAEECGLSFQLNYFDPIKADMAIHPSRHVTADANFLEMKTEYDRLLRDGCQGSQGQGEDRSARWRRSVRAFSRLHDRGDPRAEEAGWHRLPRRAGHGRVRRARRGERPEQPRHRRLPEQDARALRRRVEVRQDLHHLRRGALPGLLGRAAEARPDVRHPLGQGCAAHDPAGRAQPGAVGRLGPGEDRTQGWQSGARRTVNQRCMTHVLSARTLTHQELQ